MLAFGKGCKHTTTLSLDVFAPRSKHIPSGPYHAEVQPLPQKLL